MITASGNLKRKVLVLNSKEKNKFEKKKRARLLLVYFMLVLFFLVFGYRAIKYQVIDRDIIKSQVENQLTRKIPLRAMRGQILDRNGKVLAFSRETYDIEVVHEKNEVDQATLEKINKAYSKANLDEMTQKMRQSEQRYVTVLEDLPIEVAEVIGKEDYAKIGVIKRFKRIYPNGELAAKILGTISKDGYGVSGIEEKFQDKLAGVDGYIETQTDLLGRRNPFSDAIEVKAKDGDDIVLTIDSAIQHFVYNIIKEKRDEFEAKDVIAIVQDSKTAEILAMCSTYSFDPNNPQEIKDEKLKEEYQNASTDEARSEILLKMWSDPIVSSNYEPGSTMKVVASIIGIDENVVSTTTPFVCNGITEIDGEPVKCYSYPGSHGPLDFKHGFMMSCNVVYAELSKNLDIDVYYKYLENLGLLDEMDIGLFSTGSPVYIPKEELYNIDFAKMTFGHAISITPLHVANIAFTISNEGHLYLPSIIKSIGNEKWQKKNMGMVCTPETTYVIKDYMKASAELYNERHNVPGYSAGVKTGTTVKIVDGEYDDNTVITSVIHIAPIDDPRINIIVIIDEPQTSRSSISTAGVVARDISDECLRYLKIEPDGKIAAEFNKVPNFVGLNLAQAIDLANSSQLKLEYDKAKVDMENMYSYKVKYQKPVEGSLVAKDSTVSLVLEKDILEE